VSLDCSVNNPPISPPHADVHDGVFVVVPAYNEAPAIGAVLHELRAVYPNVVVVDDGSTDGTHEAARAWVTYVLRHPINCGQGAALQTGIDFALLQGAEFIVTFDADGQHRVEDVAALLSPILSGEYDIALGSRFLGTSVGLPPLRRRMLRLGVLFTRLVNGVNLTDAHNGLRAFSRRAAQRINLRLDRMAHATELIDQVRQSGLPFKEVPVQIRYTPYSLRKGQSTRGAIRIALHYLLGRVLQ
jgi:glycosyltransferase involved in cell wall biosynthesis